MYDYISNFILSFNTENLVILLILLAASIVLVATQMIDSRKTPSHSVRNRLADHARKRSYRSKTDDNLPADVLKNNDRVRPGTYVAPLHLNRKARRYLLSMSRRKRQQAETVGMQS